MHPGTKRKIFYAIIAIGAIAVISIASYTIIMSSCPSSCQWITSSFPPHCDCPGVPPGEDPWHIPEGIPGFPLEAVLIGLLIAVVFILAIRRRNQ